MKKCYFLLTYQVLTTITFLVLFSHMGISNSSFFVMMFPIQLASCQIWIKLAHSSSKIAFVSFQILAFLSTTLYQLLHLPKEGWRITLLVISLFLCLILYIVSLLPLIKNTD